MNRTTDGSLTYHASEVEPYRRLIVACRRLDHAREEAEWIADSATCHRSDRLRRRISRIQRAINHHRARCGEFLSSCSRGRTTLTGGYLDVDRRNV